MWATIRLGSFVLESPQGSGSTAAVWRGTHPDSGAPIAAKIFRPEVIARPENLWLFRREVRASAGLSHPNVVSVFHQGEVDAEAARLGGLEEGSPYLISEWVGGGTLVESYGDFSWPRLKRVALGILEGLGHAHARGVIHRDLKPGNVLLTASGWRAKIADFGIAHLHDSIEGIGGERAPFRGTPSYAAPEQILGDVRSLGPWTDLYSLGCTLYALCAGKPPFAAARAGGPQGILSAHLTDAPPPLQARFSVPGELQGWLFRLLAKDPRQRYRRAADAALGLLALDEGRVEPLEEEWTDAALMAAPTLMVGATTISDGEDWPGDEETVHSDSATVTENLEWPGVPSEGPSSTPPEILHERPGFPADWRHHRAAPAVLHDAGLSLYGLRPIELVGRHEERDRLWAVLGSVVNGGGARCALIEGAAGTGKSHLASWLSQRAHEVGAVNVLRVAHGPDQDPEEGLRQLVSRDLACEGLEGADLVTRVTEVLEGQQVRDAGEVAALCELVSPGASLKLEHPVVFGSARERYALVQRLLARRCRLRPVVLWLDDIQWGPDTGACVAEVMGGESSFELPILVVMTARIPEGGGEDVYAGSATTRRLASDCQMKLTVLPEEEWPLLASAVLDVSGAVATDIGRRAGGHPLFVVQLIGDWVARGILVRGPRGWVPTVDAGELSPVDLSTVWRERVEHLLQGRSVRSAVGLEVAALLGHEVERSLWSRACVFAGGEAADDLVEEMMASGLAVPLEEEGRDGWRFGHGMLRDCLQARSREAGRLSDQHHACAEVFGAKGGTPAPGRRGRHLLGAGFYVEAIQPLLEGISNAMRGGFPWEAEALLTGAEDALLRLGIRPGDSRWMKVRLARAGLEDKRGNCGASEEILLDVQGMAHRMEDNPARVAALRMLAKLHVRGGSFNESLKVYEEAMEIARDSAPPETIATLFAGMAFAHVWTGQSARGRELGERALALYRDHGMERSMGMGQLCRTLARLAIAEGALDEAGSFARESLSIADEVGDRQTMALANNSLGEIARFAGRWREAEGYYREAIRFYRAMGSADAMWSEMNLALGWTTEGRYTRAAPLLLDLLERSAHHHDRVIHAGLHAYLVACAAGQGQWNEYTHHLEALLGVLEETGLVEIDVPTGLELAGRLAAQAGRVVEARSAFRVAQGQWQAMDRTADVARVGERLGALKPDS